MRLKNIGALSLIKGVSEMQLNKKNNIQRQGQRIFYIISKKTKKKFVASDGIYFILHINKLMQSNALQCTT